jgi:DnaJ-class molecular chaperone
MTVPPSVQTIIQHHLRALAEQDDASEAQQQRDTAIRTLLEAQECPACDGAGGSIGIGGEHWPCPDCAGTGKPPKAATIAQLVTDASPADRGLSRERIRQIKDGTR